MNRPSKKATKGQRTSAQRRSSSPSRRTRRGRPSLIFARQNYVLLVIGVLAIIVGYAIMRLENEVDGIISLYIAPLLILGGYLEIMYAILWRPKQSSESTDG